MWERSVTRRQLPDVRAGASGSIGLERGPDVLSALPETVELMGTQRGQQGAPMYFDLPQSTQETAMTYQRRCTFTLAQADRASDYGPEGL